MVSSAYFIDPLALSMGVDVALHPFLFIALDAGVGDIPDLRLPPCPVVGVGDRTHPLASRLDTVVEAPVTVEALAASITAHPAAAAVTVQLLRGIEGQGLEAALVQESMAYGLLQGGADHAAWLAGRTAAGSPQEPGALRMDRSGDRLDLLIDRPAARNAIDRPLRDALYEAFLLAALDPSITDVRLRGAGKAFCVGADLDEFGTTRDPVEAHRIRMATLPAHAIIRCRDRLSVHVQGACMGAGLEMAAFAERISAADDAWFQLPELAMGLLPGAGGCVSLSRRIGRQRAALLILSGKRIGARTALSWGLVDEIVGTH
ncbi:MAG TPA: enoyl-CoA hydratase/isomerase family protein [Sphingobium sp.]